MLHRLADSSQRILVLERGPFLPREKDNWNYHGSFKYYSSEVMFNQDGGERGVVDSQGRSDDVPAREVMDLKW